MRSRSLYYYAVVCFVLIAITVVTLVKSFGDGHPLRYLFLIIFFIGMAVGYFRYWMKIKRMEMKEKGKLLQYGMLVFFIAVYAGIRYGVRSLISYEVSGQDYGIVLAFFILGLFVCYYGLYASFLRKEKQSK